MTGTKYLTHFIGLVFLLVITTAGVFAQSSRIQANGSLAEKIYLQLDGNVYTTGQTIWFKAIVTDAVNHIPTTLSGVLYVELIAPDEEIVEQKLVKISNGTGSGFFDLHEHYSAGSYLVRAYTAWNKNFGSDFIFSEYVNVFQSPEVKSEQPVKNITLVEKQSGEFWLKAQLNPHIIDSLHKRNLTLHLTLDGKKDTLSIKRSSGNRYLLDHALPAGARLVTLNIETENGARYATTVALDETIDLQFFPESGEMVHGLVSKIGFKALNYNGKGVSVQGNIRDEAGDLVTTFKGNHLGMGSFFIQADSGTTYYAELSSPLEKDVALKYPLPPISARGYVLSVTKAGDKIRLMASSNYPEADSIYIQATCRGIAYYLIEGRLKQGGLLSSLPAEALPEGIIAFTLMDPGGQPVAERLYFNERPESRLKINLSADKTVYRQREKTSLAIQVNDDARPVANASLSMLVINQDQMGQLQHLRKNILSCFLLGSEFRGEIEDPGYYFRKENKDRLTALDNLLLTQGWRKYHYNKPLGDVLPFAPEPTLNVSGTVGGIFSTKKPKEGIGLSMMTFGQSMTVQVHTTDSLGRFYFNMNEEYGQKLNILIQSTGKSGKNRNFTITLDEKISPPVTYSQKSAIKGVDSIVYALAEKQRERKSKEEAYLLSSGTTVLEEVVVEDSRLTPQRKKVTERYGEPDVVIDGDAIREKEEKWSFGLYSVLLFNYPKDIRIRRTGGPGGFLRAEVVGGETTLVVVDGIPVAFYDYSLIPNISPSEVRSVELIKFAKNFMSLYMEAAPQANPMSIPASGSVIAIYTHTGKGIYFVDKPTGILKKSIPVFAAPREFYTPKYDKLLPEDAEKPDLRAVLHWSPQIKTDSAGHFTTSFYNADVAGKMLVVVEAISDDGQIGYQEMIYEVENVTAQGHK